jgi:hypothetical protein
MAYDEAYYQAEKKIEQARLAVWISILAQGECE